MNAIITALVKNRYTKTPIKTTKGLCEMNLSSKTIEIDFSNTQQLQDLMDMYGNVLEQMIFGKNERGEDQHISINPDNIIVETFQSNHWIRKNIYWYDGTIEETFEGKWN